MRISDWSSDVCSSDLAEDRAALGMRLDQAVEHVHVAVAQAGLLGRDHDVRPAQHLTGLGGYVQGHDLVEVVRSEEHTSELQSLMRISYAVFCLKKKKNHNILHKDNYTENAKTDTH